VPSQDTPDNTVILLNASNEVLKMLHWTDAITMVVRGDAFVHTQEGDRIVHSAGGLEVPWPAVVQLNRYVYVPFTQRIDTTSSASFGAVLDRDRRTCIYCGHRGTTVDHIMPKSRGGGNTWGNLAACCWSCNNIKADRTPEEAGMKLLWEPRPPKDAFAALNRFFQSSDALPEEIVA